MYMKKILLVLAFGLTTGLVDAAEMMRLLKGDYDAKVLTTAEMDSILNPKDATRYRLEYENKQQLFRHSYLADYYLVDTQKNVRIRMSDQPVRDAYISPNGKYVVYAKG